jgi:hypothetical protein
MRAFLPVCESTEPAILANSRKGLSAPGEKFVSIALMPYIPHDLITGAFENAM